MTNRIGKGGGVEERSGDMILIIRILKSGQIGVDARRMELILLMKKRGNYSGESLVYNSGACGADRFERTLKGIHKFFFILRNKEKRFKK